MLNKIIIHFALCKHPGKSYRNRHNKSCQGLMKIKTFKNKARSPKPEDPLKKKEEKDGNT